MEFVQYPYLQNQQEITLVSGDFLLIQETKEVFLRTYLMDYFESTFLLW